jgi:hypothetical protein
LGKTSVDGDIILEQIRSAVENPGGRPRKELEYLEPGNFFADFFGATVEDKAAARMSPAVLRARTRLKQKELRKAIGLAL